VQLSWACKISFDATVRALGLWFDLDFDDLDAELGEDAEEFMASSTDRTIRASVRGPVAG